MDSFINQTPKEENKVSIILPTEKAFSIKLLGALGKSYKVIKSRDKWNNIDFLILNRINIKHLYIEYKKRTGNSRKFNSVIINECKIRAIKKDYNRCLFVFDYDNSLDFIKYDDKVFSDFSGCKVKNQDVRKIPNYNLKDGFDNLIEFIKNDLN